MSTLSGTVKNYGAQKGFGFIACDAVEGDIYFQSRELPAELQGQDLALKDCTVFFELHHTADGKPQAKQVQVESAENLRLQGGGTPSLNGEEQQHTGEVKSFNAAKGFGFLACAVLGCDVYFNMKDVPMNMHGAPLIGMKANFGVVVTADGKHQARHLRFSGAPAKGPMGGKGMMMDPMAGKGMMMGGKDAMMKGMMKGGPPPWMFAPPQAFGAYMGMAMGQSYGPYGAYPPAFKGYDKGGYDKGGYDKGYGKGPPPMKGGGKGEMPAEGASVCGMVKNVDAAKGFGFITVTGIQSDVYFKVDEANPVETGMSVTFTIKWMKDGKPQGRDLQPGLSAGDTHEGAIKSYSEKHGYGFLRVGESSQDVYFQRRGLPAELQAATSAELIGIPMRFTVELKPDGKPQAHSLEPTDGSAVPAAASSGAKRPAGELSGAPAPSSVKYPRLSTPPPSGRPVFGGGKGGAAPAGGQAEGTIKHFNIQKGFGFIEAAGVQGDVYFKGTMLPPHLQAAELQGMQVSFDLKYTPDGKPQAGQIQVDGM